MKEELLPNCYDHRLFKPDFDSLRDLNYRQPLNLFNDNSFFPWRSVTGISNRDLRETAMSGIC